jgi:transposase InsO family protein
MEEAIQMIKTVILPWYGVPRILISDGGSHFIGKDFKRCFAKLGIEHRVSTAYHPQTNGQEKTSNKRLKGILMKTVTKGGKDWSKKLDGVLCTTWKTGFGNRLRSPLVTGNAPVTNQVLQIRQER